jgi:hypothetical protein
MIKKTFVEWCKDFDTYNKDPFVVQQKDFHPNMHKIREINELMDYWDREMQKKIREACIISTPLRL